MENLVYKVYKGMPKELIYMTFNTENAARKYFMHIRENPVIEIWNGQLLVEEYRQNVYDLKAIRNSLECLSILLE